MHKARRPARVPIDHALAHEQAGGGASRGRRCVAGGGRGTVHINYEKIDNCVKISKETIGCRLIHILELYGEVKRIFLVKIKEKINTFLRYNQIIYC